MVQIGIDFGTNFTYMGFVHGVDLQGNDVVQALVPDKCGSRGIPSVYYNDGEKELFGTDAVKAAKKNPDCSVTSIKRKLRSGKIMLGEQSFQPKEIVQRMFTYYLETAERLLREQFIIDPDGIDVVLTVPYDFDNAETLLLRRALESVRLSSGVPVYVKYVCVEPVASAVRFLGLRAEPDIYVLVFDLGGGTLDIALVHDEPNSSSPYKVVDFGGDRELGGDDWDDCMKKLLAEEYEKAAGAEVSKSVRKKINEVARNAKEELSTLIDTEVEVDAEGETIIEISREQFENASSNLLSRAMDKLRAVLSDNADKKIKYIILTGGGSRMPQISNAIAALDVLPEGVEVRCFNPEKSISEGAAVLAYQLRVPDRKPIDMIAPHGYGVIYNIESLGNERMIRIFIKKGERLPASASVSSYMPDLPEEKRTRSTYTICETDVTEEGSDPYEKGRYVSINGIMYTALYQGREVLDVGLCRNNPVDTGTETISTISIDDSLKLTFTAKDIVNNAEVSRDVNLSGKNTGF